MNKNQRQIRRLAVKQGGTTYRVNRAYDKSCSLGKATGHSFISRAIPLGRQEQKSNGAKVARRGTT